MGWPYPSECCLKFLYAALMCAVKKFIKHRKFRHLPYMYNSVKIKRIRELKIDLIWEISLVNWFRTFLPNFECIIQNFSPIFSPKRSSWISWSNWYFLISKSSRVSIKWKFQTCKFQNPILIHVSSKIVIFGARYFYYFKLGFASKHISGFSMLSGTFWL